MGDPYEVPGRKSSQFFDDGVDEIFLLVVLEADCVRENHLYGRTAELGELDVYVADDRALLPCLERVVEQGRVVPLDES